MRTRRRQVWPAPADSKPLSRPSPAGPPPARVRARYVPIDPLARRYATRESYRRCPAASETESEHVPPPGKPPLHHRTTRSTREVLFRLREYHTLRKPREMTSRRSRRAARHKRLPTALAPGENQTQRQAVPL